MVAAIAPKFVWIGWEVPEQTPLNPLVSVAVQEAVSDNRDNNYPVKVTVSACQTVIKTMSFTVECGLTVSCEQTVKAEIPMLGGASLKLAQELNMKNTATQQQTTQLAINVSFEATVPAHRHAGMQVYYQCARIPRTLIYAKYFVPADGDETEDVLRRKIEQRLTAAGRAQFTQFVNGQQHPGRRISLPFGIEVLVRRGPSVVRGYEVKLPVRVEGDYLVALARHRPVTYDNGGQIEIKLPMHQRLGSLVKGAGTLVTAMGPALGASVGAALVMAKLMPRKQRQPETTDDLKAVLQAVKALAAKLGVRL